MTRPTAGQFAAAVVCGLTLAALLLMAIAVAETVTLDAIRELARALRWTP